MDLPKKTKEKIKKRDKKRKPKMKVSGKRVFQLKKIFSPSPTRSGRTGLGKKK